MRLHLKVLGPVLFAVLAIGAMVAQAASAVNHEFEVTTAPAVLTGDNFVTGETSTQVFTVSEGVGVVTCDVILEGTQEEEVQDKLSLYPEYSNCSQDGVGKATVTNNGCTFKFESDTVVNHAPVSLDCDHKNSITIEIGEACIIHFSDTHEGSSTTVNQNLSGVVYKNQNFGEGKHAVEVDATVTGITYVATGAFCELLGIPPGTNHDGVVEGEVAVYAFEDVGSAKASCLHTYEHNNKEVGLTVKLNTES